MKDQPKAGHAPGCGSTIKATRPASRILTSHAQLDICIETHHQLGKEFMQSINKHSRRIAHRIGLSRSRDNLDLASRFVNGLGASLNVRDLFEAAASGDETKVELLLGSAGPDIRQVLDDALALAARNGRVAIAAKLIQAGADVHELEEEPLRWAAEAGHTTTVEFLLVAGANPHVRDDAPLRAALANAHAETAKVLKHWSGPS